MTAAAGTPGRIPPTPTDADELYDDLMLLIGATDDVRTLQQAWRTLAWANRGWFGEHKRVLTDGTRTEAE